MNAMEVIDRFEAMRDAMDRELEEQNETIRQKEAMMLNKNRTNEEKKAEMGARDRKIEVLKGEIDKQKELLGDLAKEEKELDDIVAALTMLDGAPQINTNDSGDSDGVDDEEDKCHVSPKS